MRRILSIMMLLPMLAMAGCTAKADQRTGEAEGYGGTLRVSVTMNGTDVTEVKVIEHSETPGVGTRAIDALPDRIAQADSIDVDSVSGATITSEAIKQAVGQAMGMAGMMQQIIPMDGANTSKASSTRGKMGMGMAATGRVGPGKDDEGGQVYSMNVVFASGEFAEDGVIRAIRVDQLEVVSPNLGSGNMFSGFPTDAGSADAFLKAVAAWQTKGMMGDDYMLKSGSWREQMDEYERMMVGKTVSEVKEWYQNRGNAAGAASGTNTAAESQATTASDVGSAQPMNGMADADMTGSAQTDASSSATMSLQGEYGDVLLAIERAWEDAKSGQSGTRLDTNTVTDATQGETSEG
nr:FMN-binding protein [Clostridia bacterium]